MAQAKAKGNSVVTTIWENSVLTISVLGAGSVMFDQEKASKANREAAERHGWTQRLCDRAAIAAPTRKALTSEAEWLGILAAHKAAKHAAIKELAEYYESGDVPWKMVSGGPGDGGLLFTALCEFKPKVEPAKLQARLKDSTPEQLAAFRAIPEVVDIMNRLRKERLAKVDTSGALDDLNAMEGGEENDESAE